MYTRSHATHTEARRSRRQGKERQEQEEIYTAQRFIKNKIETAAATSSCLFLPQTHSGINTQAGSAHFCFLFHLEFGIT